MSGFGLPEHTDDDVVALVAAAQVVLQTYRDGVIVAPGKTVRLLATALAPFEEDDDPGVTWKHLRRPDRIRA